MLRVGRENDRQMDRGGRSQRRFAKYSATRDERDPSGVFSYPQRAHFCEPRWHRGAFPSLVERISLPGDGFFFPTGEWRQLCSFYPRDGGRTPEPTQEYIKRRI